MTSKGNSKLRRIKSARGSWFNSPYRTKSALLAPDQTIYAEFLILDFKWASAEALLVLLIFLLRVISFRSQGSEDSRRSHLYLSGKIVSRYINLNPEIMRLGISFQPCRKVSTCDSGLNLNEPSSTLLSEMQCNLECSAVGRNIINTSHSTSEMNFFTMIF